MRDESSDGRSVCSHAGEAKKKTMKKMAGDISSRSESSFSSVESPFNSPKRSAGKLMSSYRLPQFFQQTEEQIARIERKSTKRKINIIRQATKTKLAEDPDELVKDMADFLQEVGYTSSFIDQDYV
jgi:hypothetical protein